jgi:hypothetical protein
MQPHIATHVCTASCNLTSPLTFALLGATASTIDHQSIQTWFDNSRSHMHLTRISTQHIVCTRAFVYRLSKRPSRTRRTRRLSRTRRRRRKKRGSPTLMTTTGRMTSRASLSRRRRRGRGRRSSPTQRTSFKAKYILRSVHIGIHMYLTTGKYKHVLCANCITLSVSTTIKTINCITLSVSTTIKTNR